jgi:hypothetical protein
MHSSHDLFEYAPSKGEVVLRIRFKNFNVQYVFISSVYILFIAALSHQPPGFKFNLNGMPRTVIRPIFLHYTFTKRVAKTALTYYVLV